jgi:hypothetical protein
MDIYLVQKIGINAGHNITPSWIEWVGVATTLESAKEKAHKKYTEKSSDRPPIKWKEKKKLNGTVYWYAHVGFCDFEIIKETIETLPIIQSLQKQNKKLRWWLDNSGFDSEHILSSPLDTVQDTHDCLKQIEEMENV